MYIYICIYIYMYIYIYVYIYIQYTINNMNMISYNSVNIYIYMNDMTWLYVIYIWNTVICTHTYTFLQFISNIPNQRLQYAALCSRFYVLSSMVATVFLPIWGAMELATEVVRHNRYPVASCIFDMDPDVSRCLRFRLHFCQGLMEIRMWLSKGIQSHVKVTIPLLTILESCKICAAHRQDGRQDGWQDGSYNQGCLSAGSGATHSMLGTVQFEMWSIELPKIVSTGLLLTA